MRTVEHILAALESDGLPGFDDGGGLEINGRYRAFGELPLHIFAIRGDYEACRALADAGSEINVPGEHRYTPLHEAASRGHIEIVRLLLQRGADANLNTDLGPMELLAVEYPEILQLIRRHRESLPVNSRCEGIMASEMASQQRRQKGFPGYPG